MSQSTPRSSKSLTSEDIKAAIICRDDAAALCKCSTRTMDRALERGDIQGIYLTKFVILLRSEVEELARQMASTRKTRGSAKKAKPAKLAA